MRLCSFGRDLLSPRSSSLASLRRVVRTVLAARRRWPDGRLVLRFPVAVSCPLDAESSRWCGWLFVWRGWLSGGWYAGDGCCGVSFGTLRGLSEPEWFLPRPAWLGGPNWREDA